MHRTLRRQRLQKASPLPTHTNMKTALIQLAMAMCFSAFAGAAQFIATFLPELSAMHPTGLTFQDATGKTFTTATDDPKGPFNNSSCTFRGWGVGGSAESLNGAYLVYRMRLDFDEEVILNSFVEAAIGDHRSPSFIRLLDTNRVVLSSEPITEFNILVTNKVTGHFRGRTFFIDVFDQSGGYRYRESYRVSYTPVSAVPIQIQVASIAVSWPSETNHIYQVQYSTRLAPNTWLGIGAQVPGDGDTKMLFDSALNEERRFYRVVRLQ